MSAICLLSACYCLSARYRQYWHTALLMMMIWSRAWNEGCPKIREDFTITEKAPTSTFTFKTLCYTGTKLATKFYVHVFIVIHSLVWNRRFVSSSTPEAAVELSRKWCRILVPRAGVRSARGSNTLSLEQPLCCMWVRKSENWEVKVTLLQDAGFCCTGYKVWAKTEKLTLFYALGGDNYMLWGSCDFYVSHDWIDSDWMSNIQQCNEILKLLKSQLLLRTLYLSRNYCSR